MDLNFLSYSFERDRTIPDINSMFMMFQASKGSIL